MKLLLVFNPQAGGGRAKKLLSAVRSDFQGAGIVPTVAVTEYSGHAERIVSEADLAEFDAVAVAGGDGSLFQAVNGMMNHPAEARLPLGLVPMGTGNAFCRDIGLVPDAWRSGVQLICAGNLKRVDVGRIQSGSGTFFFINIAGFGFVTDAGKTAARLKFTGRSAYTLATLWRCLRLRSHALELEVDGQLFTENNLFVEISNSRYTGTSFLISPGARIDDGLLDITMVRRLSRSRLLRLFPTIYSGKHVQYDEVTTLQGREISIRAPAGLELMVDGEFRGSTPARIDCLAGAIEMFAS